MDAMFGGEFLKLICYAQEGSEISSVGGLWKVLYDSKLVFIGRGALSGNIVPTEVDISVML